MKKVSLVVVTDSDQEAILISNLMRKSEIEFNGLRAIKCGRIESLTEEDEQEISDLLDKIRAESKSESEGFEV